MGRLHPYLSCKMTAGPGTDHPKDVTKTTIHVTRAEVLLSLGILLIELCFGKTLEGMQVPEDSKGDANESRMQYNIARRLLFGVDNDAGLNYGDAVRSCLDFSRKIRASNVEYDEFQREVFCRIVTPLKTDLDINCGINFR